MIEDLQELENKINNLLKNRKDIRILEAGCGSMSHIQFSQDAYLIGVDISSEQLERNKLLHERFLHDIQDANFPVSGFDLIVCWDVLEHLPKPRHAISNFLKIIKEDGYVLLASPNVMSLRGLITKFTPHWFHVWFYRNIYGLKNAGKNGHGPFKSFHKFSISPEVLKKFAQGNNLSIEFFKTYEIEHPEKNNKQFKIIWDLANTITKIISLGSIGTDKDEGFIMVLSKNPKKLI